MNPMHLLRPAERLLDALTDPARREYIAARLLIAYCAVWSLYGALAKGSQDIHFDMGEMVAWSREAGIGTPKHPPFAAWLVRAWFSVFPLADWSYYLFAMVLASFALWVAWRVSEPYLDGEKRVAGLVLLTFIPFFNFHALKYNANTVLIPLWAVDHLVFPAFIRNAQRDMGGVCRPRGGLRDAGKILVDLPARRPRGRGARRPAPHRLPALERALDHDRGRRSCDRAAPGLDRGE